jgi:hypothetical protein
MFQDGCLLGCAVKLGRRSLHIALMMEASSTSKMSNPEDSHLRNHRRETLKSYSLIHVSIAVTSGRIKQMAV